MIKSLLQSCYITKLQVFNLIPVCREGSSRSRFSEIFGKKEGTEPLFSFFYEFLEFLTDLCYFCYTLVKRVCNLKIISTLNPVTKCNKVKKKGYFVTFCYILLQIGHHSLKSLLHFVTLYLVDNKYSYRCNKCNKIFLATNSAEFFSHNSGFILDKTGQSRNLIPGEMLRSYNRIFEITDVWFQGIDKQVYEITEYFFPFGWQQLIQNNPEKLILMKASYPKKALEVEAQVIHDQILSGVMVFI